MSKAVEAAARAVAVFNDETPDAPWPFDKQITCAQAYEGVAQAAVTAYLAAREAEGWVMVPVEPTQDMISAAWRREPKHPNPTEAYRAMLAARPTEGDK